MKTGHFYFGKNRTFLNWLDRDLIRGVDSLLPILLILRLRKGGEELVKMRLRRLGAHKRPFYRLVVVDSRAKRNGPFIEILGTYNPLKKPSEIKIDLEKARYWLQRGAQPTDTTKKLLQRVGIDS